MSLQYLAQFVYIYQKIFSNFLISVKFPFSLRNVKNVFSFLFFQYLIHFSFFQYYVICLYLITVTLPCSKELLLYPTILFCRQSIRFFSEQLPILLLKFRYQQSFFFQLPIHTINTFTILFNIFIRFTKLCNFRIWNIPHSPQKGLPYLPK